MRDVFAELSKDKAQAAQHRADVAEADKPTAAKELIDAGRRLVFLKGTDSHDYKFSSAVMEDACTSRRRGATASWPLVPRQALILG